MFKSENDLQIKNQDLRCVWIRVNDNPGGPLMCIWTDAKMRGFEDTETGSVAATADSDVAEQASGDGLCALTVGGC